MARRNRVRRLPRTRPVGTGPHGRALELSKFSDYGGAAFHRGAAGSAGVYFAAGLGLRALLHPRIPEAVEWRSRCHPGARSAHAEVDGPFRTGREAGLAVVRRGTDL